MLRTYQYPLHPNRKQEANLLTWLARCADLHNAALEQRRDAWRKQRVSIGLYQQYKELTELRRADPEWAAVPQRVARNALTRLDRAFQAFFRRCEAGETPGYPRFRARDRYDSVALPFERERAHGIRIEGDRVLLPKLGAVRFNKYREMRGEVREVRIKRGARGWFVSFVCDLGAAPAKKPVASVIGIDMGLEAFATLSDGARIENPRYLRESEDVLARRQRALENKQRGSQSRRRAKVLVARAHEHVRNQRIDFARKLAALLFARFDLIAHEDLAISHMVHGNLAKSIHDAAWGIFLGALHSKAEEAGKWCVPVDPRGTSQRCSGCGSVVHKTLSQREHHCDRCGLVLHRDENAARNVLALGLSVGQLTEASRDAEPDSFDTPEAIR